MGVKISVNKKVRELLVELDSAFQQLHSANRAFNDSQGALDQHVEKTHCEKVIMGIAWRINNAATGRNIYGE